MSKPVLSIEQMQYLKELGVDTSKASMVLLWKDDEGNEMDWDEVQDELSHPEPMEMFKELYDAETGNYDHSYRKYCGVFTLQDILDLLPRSVDDELILFIEKSKHKWRIGYDDVETDEIFEDFSDVNMIDAAYEMLCWVIDNGYLKVK